MEHYEFFKKEFEFRGKHAKMAGELWVANDYEHTYFKRLIDLYILAAVIGFRMDRRAEEDYSPFEPRSIFPEQMIKAKEDLQFIMQIMEMLEEGGNLSKEEKVKKAFSDAESKEKFEQLRNRFNSYVRGGVEELYERLIIRKSEPGEPYYQDKTANMMELVERFAPKSSFS